MRTWTCIFTCLLLITTLTAFANAGTVNWPGLGMDEALITGPGQVFTDFAGISGLSVTVSGTAGFNAPYVHATGRLWFRSKLGTVGSIPPTVATFVFSQPVVVTLGVHHFGDGNVREQLTCGSLGGGPFSAVIGAGGTITGNNTSQVHLLSADSYGGSGGTVIGNGIQVLQMTLDGADERDIAGISMTMDIEALTVDAETTPLGSIKALYR